LPSRSIAKKFRWSYLARSRSPVLARKFAWSMIKQAPREKMSDFVVLECPASCSGGHILLVPSNDVVAITLGLLIPRSSITTLIAGLSVSPFVPSSRRMFLGFKSFVESCYYAGAEGQEHTAQLCGPKVSTVLGHDICMMLLCQSLKHPARRRIFGGMYRPTVN
jgi:hypothetical protein